GSFQHSAFSFPGLRQLWVEFFPTPGRLFNSRFNGRYPLELNTAQTPVPVDFVLGATMMLRREVIEQTGMFDEQFFMYCEEVDWAWRIHQAGWNVCYIPSAHVTHLAGKSSVQVRPQALKYLWKSRLLLFDKHYAPVKRTLARKMVVYGMQSKLRRLQSLSGLTEQDRAALADAYTSIREMAS
ncbi:MAG: glycosyltransferase, partial [Chloroflexota bacterium]